MSDLSHRTGATRRVIESAKRKEESQWQKLTPGQKVLQWAKQNQYSVILGSWAVSMAIAGTIVMRDRYGRLVSSLVCMWSLMKFISYGRHQSTSQKVVQARMWAQGLTIGVLVGAGILTHQQRQEAAEHRGVVDHSWKDVVSRVLSASPLDHAHPNGVFFAA